MYSAHLISGSGLCLIGCTCLFSSFTPSTCSIDIHSCAICLACLGSMFSKAWKQEVRDRVEMVACALRFFSFLASELDILALASSAALPESARAQQLLPFFDKSPPLQRFPVLS